MNHHALGTVEPTLFLIGRGYLMTALDKEGDAAGNGERNEDDDEPEAHIEIIIAPFGYDDSDRQYEADGHERGEG